MDTQSFLGDQGDYRKCSSTPNDTLTEEDSDHFCTAEACLQAGDHIGSSCELNYISLENRTHPNFLTLRWRAFAKAGEWRGAYEVAEVFSQVVPHVPEPWLLLAEAAWHLADMGPTKAIEILVEAASRLYHEPILPFTLACDTCGLGRLEEAHKWWMTTLSMAKQQGTDKEWKRKALFEQDLAPLWNAE